MSATAGCYVYYRVSPENKAALRRAVMSLFSDLQARTGVTGRLARRRDDPGTWMEIYERVLDPERFEAELREASERHGLDALVAPGSKRIAEIFISDVLDPGSGDGSNTLCA